MANHRVYVLDDVGALAAPGEVGELAVAGPGVARGYLGDPEGTAARFRADPVHPGARMHLTGDWPGGTNSADCGSSAGATDR